MISVEEARKNAEKSMEKHIDCILESSGEVLVPEQFESVVKKYEDAGFIVKPPSFGYYTVRLPS